MEIPPQLSSAPARKKKILWVEDDQMIGSILSQKIVSSDFDLMRTLTGNEALKELQTLTPDAIIVDLLLPDMNGFQILEKLASDQRLKKIPRMVLSNLDDKSDKEKATKLGVKKYLVKALTPLDRIIVEIRDLCEA